MIVRSETAWIIDGKMEAVRSHKQTIGQPECCQREGDEVEKRYGWKNGRGTAWDDRHGVGRGGGVGGVGEEEEVVLFERCPIDGWFDWPASSMCVVC